MSMSTTTTSSSPVSGESILGGSGSVATAATSSSSTSSTSGVGGGEERRRSSKYSKKDLYPAMTEEMPMSTYYETMPHKYHEIQNRYTQALISGRHPISFQRKSELWHHFNNSKERTDAIAKGHGVWSTIEIEHEKIQNDASEFDLKPKGRVYQSGIMNKRAKENSINNVQIDSKSLVHLHFGMSMVIMNYLDEVLVATKFNELKCKEREKVLPTDKIVFKIVDIEDPTNPSALYLGDQMWLQCCENDELDEDLMEDDSMEKGLVLGAKLFAPPEMKVVQLDLAWGSSSSNNKKEELKSSKSVDYLGGKEYASKFGSNPPPPSKSTSTSGSLGSHEEKKSRDSTTPATTEASSSSAFAASSTDSPASKQSKSETSSPSSLDGRLASPPDDSDKKTKGNDIVGTAGLVRICDSVTLKTEGPDGLPLGQQKITTKYVGKIALQSGRWVPVDAQRKASEEKKTTYGGIPDATTDPKKKKEGSDGHGGGGGAGTDKREKLMSLTPVYLEQDLYVLGSTHGTTYQPWPKFSLDFCEISSLKMDSKKSMLDMPASGVDTGSVGESDEPRRPSTSEGMANMSGGESVTRRFNIAKAGDHLETYPHLCLRKKVHQAPPYAFVIDRRCVWKFHIVENPGALTGNTKDQQAQRIMIKAKESLKKSEMQRKGARVHSEVKFEGEKLLGGESFSKTLRAVLMQTSLDLECKALFERRSKEKNLMKTFEDLYLTPDPAMASDEHSQSKRSSSRTSLRSGFLDDNSSLDSFNQSSIDSTNVRIDHRLSTTFITGGGGGASSSLSNNNSNNNSRNTTPSKESKDDASSIASVSSNHSKNNNSRKNVPEKSGRVVGLSSSSSGDRKPGLLSSSSSTSTITGTGERKETPPSKSMRSKKDKEMPTMASSMSDGALLNTTSITSMNSAKKSVRFDTEPKSASASNPISADPKETTATTTPDKTKGSMSFGLSTNSQSSTIGYGGVKYKSRSTIMEDSKALSQSIASFSTPKSPVAKSLLTGSPVFNGFSNANLDNLKKPSLVFQDSYAVEQSLEIGDRFNTPVYCTIPKIHSTYISGPKSFAGYKELDDSEKEKQKKQTFGSSRRQKEEKVDNQEGHSFSQGEKVIALHNSMTTSMEIYKAKLEASEKKKTDATMTSLTPSQESPHDDNFKQRQKDEAASSLARCRNSLSSEDKLIAKAISYKDKVEQYRRVSKLFSDITF